MGIIEWLDSAVTDARYGLRQLRKTPALVAAIVLSLAIGVGANTAIFSLVDAALLKPLPVHDPDALRIIEWTNEGFPKAATNINGDVSPLAGGNKLIGSSIGANLYRALAREQNGFQSLLGIADANPAAIAVDSSPAEQVNVQHVSDNFFQAIGVAPVLGRPFREEEDRVGQEPVVIVSYRFWQNRLGGDAGAFQRTVRINSVPARIVGVAPRDFLRPASGPMDRCLRTTGSTSGFPGQPECEWASRGKRSRLVGPPGGARQSRHV